MRELRSKVITYLRDKHNLRKVVITSAAVFLLLGVVLFSADIGKLLNLPWGTRADTPIGPKGSDLTWIEDGLPNLHTPRSNAKLIDVVDGAGDRWLYAIGGINQVLDDADRPEGEQNPGGTRLNLVKEVERIQLDNNPNPANSEFGKPVGGWQYVDAMNFGHAEFGLIVYGDYICVIAGDIHVRKIGMDSEDILRAWQYPLTYSTIEILNYKEPADTWQVHSLLTGVNFYPEVTLIGDQLHIVGGVYGNPFLSDNFRASPEGWAALGATNIYEGYYTGDGTPSQPATPYDLMAKDPLMLADDLIAWDSLNLASKRVIGVGENGDAGVPLVIHRGAVSDPIIDPNGSNSSPDELPDFPDTPNWDEIFPSRWLTLARNNDVGWDLSYGVLNGGFYTTVSEHYILDLTRLPSEDAFVIQTGELGLDYNDTSGQPTNSWVLNQVVSLGHLKLHAYIAYSDQRQTPPYELIAVSPVSQGRYGHKAIVHNEALLVLGGASWSSPYMTVQNTSEETCTGDMCLLVDHYSRAETHHFWVIDDDIDPIVPVGVDDYEFVGNIAYRWDPVNDFYWKSTNADAAGYPNRKLANSYAFKSPEAIGGNKKGRAFFGLAELDFSETTPISNNYRTAVAVGGLQNESGTSSTFGIDCTGSSCSVTWVSLPVEVTNRTEELADDSIGWEDQPEISTEGSYNLSSVGIDKNRSISFDGQLKFQYTDDPMQRIMNPVHVPNYQRTGAALSDKTTSMFVGGSWWPMPFTDPPDPSADNGMNQFTFSAVKDVRSVDTNGKTTVYIYKIGGVVAPGVLQHYWLPILPTVSSDAQYLGPFIYGQPGVPDVPESIFTVDPPVVEADGVSYATATLTLRDYNEDPIAGVKAIVATDNNSSWPPNDTDDILIRPLDETQSPATPWPSPWLLTDASGQAKFKLTSLKEIPLDQVCVYISTSTSSTPPATKAGCDSFIMPCQPIEFVGGASYLNSTIDADPYKVAADGIEYSTVTVTLLDHQDPPLPITTGDYFVKIIPDKDWVSVEDNNTEVGKINAEGKAVFKVRSSTMGKTNISARYSLSLLGLEDPDEYVTLVDTATVEFGAMIKSLVPPQGYQGDRLPSVTATGKATHWNDDTRVEFIPPSILSFHWKKDNQEGDIEELSLLANGRIVQEKIGIWAGSYPDTNVTFSIADREDGTDPGTFWPNDDTTYSTDTDASGKAYFYFRTSTDPGFTKINATVGGVSGDLWLIVQDPGAFQYELEMLASPANLLAGEQAAIRAAVYKTEGVNRNLVTTALDFNFLTDATDSVLNPGIATSVSGIATTNYARGNTDGRFHVFAWTEVDYGTDKLFIASKAIVNHKPSSGDAMRITIESITVNSLTNLVANVVVIGQTAALGFWTFRTTTSGSFSGSTFDEEIAEYPFKVLPVGLQTGPEISIQPKSGIRGVTNYRIDITGINTHFDSTSIVTFSPPSGGTSDGIKIVEDSLDIDDSLLLNLQIDIEHDAPVGFWNVTVTTGSELAIVPGDLDFLVSDDQKGYFINLSAKPDTLVRDGQSQSLIEARVGQVDLLHGSTRFIDGLTVTFDKGDDEGRLSNNTAVTQNGGLATIQYTTDAGEENDHFTMVAYTSPETNIWIPAYKDIFKVVHSYNYTLTANPTEIPLYGTPDESTLSISELPTNQRIPITLHFDGNPKGHIEPAATTSDLDGTAGSMYLAAPEGQRVIEIVRIYALATIPGFGQVRSNIEEIQIGRDASKYRIELNAVPRYVVAGGLQKSIVTAILYFQSQVVAQWPIDFALLEAAPGDSLSILSGDTNNYGVLVTEFTPGNTEGAVMVKAYPAGTGLFGWTTITKTADKFPDPCFSNISAVSHYVPADGTSYSVVTVTLRNANYVPIAGQMVTLSTEGTGRTVKLGDGSAGNAGVTNVRGQATFRVSSTAANVCDVTATFNAAFNLETDIIFETVGSLISQHLKLVVPFEMRDYDNLTWIYLTENALTNGYFINEMYTKNARPNDEIADLSNILLYLHPNKTYTIWAKGRNHKAQIKTFTTGAIGQGDIISINFSDDPCDYSKPNDVCDPGLLIGDFIPGPPADETAAPPPTPFHDNYINTLDANLLFKYWFKNHFLADIKVDSQVNSLDFSWLIKNWGPGAQGAPRPRCDV